MKLTLKQWQELYEEDGAELTQTDADKLNQTVGELFEDTATLYDRTMYFDSLDKYVDYNYEDRESVVIEQLVASAYHAPDEKYTAEEVLLEDSDIALDDGGYLRVEE